MRRLQAFFFAIFITLSASSQQGSEILNYVDPSIGGAAVLLVPTRPTVYLPNSLIRVYHLVFFNKTIL